ncbi:MAG: hypothetical protein M1827_001267 [Pycnora praestabilis]|nr:MAG: hypothetical protein M1827_001267 [Pycnora praestabilis]
MALPQSTSPPSISKPSRLNVPSPLKLTTSADERLSTIVEDGDGTPQLPKKTSHRPFSRRFQLGHPPRHDYEGPPPPYSPLGGRLSSKGERFEPVRNNKYIARRGGWKRLCILAIVVIIVIVGLVVGLVVGLRKKHDSKNTTSPPNPSPTTTPTGPFPIGSYTLETFLDSVSTNCTSNPSTWLCYPYMTYTESATASLATFNWIISASPSSPSNFTISSSQNPFTLSFTNISLELLDQGMNTERYSFRVPMNVSVRPNTTITDDNSAAMCLYNGTTFQASLYTKMANTYPPASASSSSAAPSSTSTPSDSSSSTGFKPWPYAVSVQQTIDGGDNVPACYKEINGDLGDRITAGLTSEPATDVCSCSYQNYDMPSS